MVGMDISTVDNGWAMDRHVDRHVNMFEEQDVDIWTWTSNDVDEHQRMWTCGHGHLQMDTNG
jgi:hypothetical protein